MFYMFLFFCCCLKGNDLRFLMKMFVGVLLQWKCYFGIVMFYMLFVCVFSVFDIVF